MSTQQEDRTGDRLAALRVQFIDRCRKELGILETFGRQDDLAGDDRRELSIIAHRLAGAGGTFGYPDLSISAAQLETTLDADAHHHPALEKLVRELRRIALPS